VAANLIRHYDLLSEHRPTNKGIRNKPGNIDSKNSTANTIECSAISSPHQFLMPVMQLIFSMGRENMCKVITTTNNLQHQ
jgi:hypothetical protein